MGAFYDVAYDRVLAPPKRTTGNGVAGGACNSGVVNGTTTEFEEGIDLDQSKLNGGGAYGPTDGGIASIDDLRGLPTDGAIIGRALWEGKIDLEEALNLAGA